MNNEEILSTGLPTRAFYLKKSTLLMYLLFGVVMLASSGMSINLWQKHGHAASLWRVFSAIFGPPFGIWCIGFALWRLWKPQPSLVLRREGLVLRGWTTETYPEILWEDITNSRLVDVYRSELFRRWQIQLTIKKERLARYKVSTFSRWALGTDISIEVNGLNESPARILSLINEYWEVGKTAALFYRDPSLELVSVEGGNPMATNDCQSASTSTQDSG